MFETRAKRGDFQVFLTLKFQTRSTWPRFSVIIPVHQDVADYTSSRRRPRVVFFTTQPLMDFEALINT